MSKDRVLYQALVDVVAEAADARLLSAPNVFGFRLNPDSGSSEFLLHGGFSEFRERLSEEFAAGNTHVLESDIAAYFETVDPKFLHQALFGLDVDPRIAEVLIRLMDFWNSLIPIGLPQGVWPSDYLGARIYLDRVDKGMLQKDYRFFRYSDDMRVAAPQRLQVRTALLDLVLELRAVGLHVQSAKTKLLRPADVERSMHRFHDRLAAREDLAELLDLDPYGYTSPEETLSELDEDEIVRSESLLGALLDEAYGDGEQLDFELCRTCITGYRRIRSAAAFDVALDLLGKLPALTQELVRYLRSIASEVYADKIRTRSLQLLRSRGVIHDWQKHWLLHLLNDPTVRQGLSPSQVNFIFRIALDRNVHGAVRTLAIRIVATTEDEAKIRQLKSMYADESDSDVRQATLDAVGRLGQAERNSFFTTCEGLDGQTDIVLRYIRERTPRRAQRRTT